MTIREMLIRYDNYRWAGFTAAEAKYLALRDYTFSRKVGAA